MNLSTMHRRPSTNESESNNQRESSFWFWTLSQLSSVNFSTTVMPPKMASPRYIHGQPFWSGKTSASFGITDEYQELRAPLLQKTIAPMLSSKIKTQRMQSIVRLVSAII